MSAEVTILRGELKRMTDLAEITARLANGEPHDCAAPDHWEQLEVAIKHVRELLAVPY